METRCKILQVRFNNVEIELASYKEDRAYVAAEKRALREEKAEMMDRLRKVDKGVALMEHTRASTVHG